MGWSVSDLGIAGVMVIGLPATILIVGLLFVFSGVSLYLLGLVSAIVYFLASLGVIWILKFLGVFKYGWGYASLLIIPIMTFYGWGIDNINLFSLFSPAQLLMSNQVVTLPLNDITGLPFNFTLTPEVFGIIISIAGAFFSAIGFATNLSMMRKRRRK